MPSRSDDFESFLDELKENLDTRTLPDRPISYMMMGNSVFQPTCAGDWMEFGVFKGETINMAAAAKQLLCGDYCAPVFGFDTFTGTDSRLLPNFQSTLETRLSVRISALHDRYILPSHQLL